MLGYKGQIQLQQSIRKMLVVRYVLRHFILSKKQVWYYC